MTATLRDGTPVALRPLRPADRERLGQEYLALPKADQYSRFLAPTASLTPRMLHRLVDHVDGVGHVALLLVVNGDQEIAIGRFVRADEEATEAEVAFVVKQEWQGKGAGSALCDGLVAEAHALGVTHFTATLLATNTASYRLMVRAGAVVHRELAYSGTLEISVALREPPALSPPLLSDDHM